MSVPIFQKNEKFTLKEILDELNGRDDEEILPYLNTEFKVEGVSGKNFNQDIDTPLYTKRLKIFTPEFIDRINDEVQKLCDKPVIISLAGLEEGFISLRLVVDDPKEGMITTRVTESHELDLSKEENFNSLVKRISEQVNIRRY